MRLAKALEWLMGLVGCDHLVNSNTTTHLKRELTGSERKEITEAAASALDALRKRYDPASRDEPVLLLQKWFDDGTFFKTPELKGFGFLWGEVIAQEIEVNWVVAQYEGTEYYGLNVPLTSITIAPVSMLEKRQDRRDQIDLRDFLSNTLDAVRQMKQKPEYQRPNTR